MTIADIPQDPDVQRVNSTLWYALEKAGDKCKDQKIRENLDGGARIPVTLSVDGRIDGRFVATKIVGHLQVSHDGTTSTKIKPTAEQALALALAYVPKTKREKLLAETVSEPADPALAAVAEQWVSRNTLVESRPRRGSVSFEFGDI
jgi:hypothetical protein